MFSAALDANGQCASLVIRPNAAPSLRSIVAAFVIVSVPIIGQAIILTLLGLWPVFVYSLLAVLALGFGLRAGYRLTQRRQVVSIAGEAVAVEKGHLQPEERYEFPRGWAQVIVTQEARMSGPVSHLFIRSHGRQIEVGEFLDETERRQLADRLRRMMGAERSFEATPGR